MSPLGYFGKAKWFSEGKKVNLKEALRQIEMCVGRDGGWAGGWCLKGDILGSMGKYGEAMEGYERAVGCDGGWSPAVVGMSRLGLGKGKVDLVIEWCQGSV